MDKDYPGSRGGEPPRCQFSRVRKNTGTFRTRATPPTGSAGVAGPGRNGPGPGLGFRTAGGSGPVGPAAAAAAAGVGAVRVGGGPARPSRWRGGPAPAQAPGAGGCTATFRQQGGCCAAKVPPTGLLLRQMSDTTMEIIFDKRQERCQRVVTGQCVTVLRLGVPLGSCWRCKSKPVVFGV